MTQSPDPESARRQFIARFIDDVRIARQAGHHVDDQTLIDSHAELMPELGAELEKLRRIEAARRAAEAAAPSPVALDRSNIPPSLFEDLTQPPPQVPGYSVLREISRGGQAVVYLATQLSTSRKVALKLMRDGPFATERALTRFRREVQSLAALNHPNIVAIIDTGKTPDGFRFIAMNYIAGANLNDFMRNLYKKDSADPGKLLRTFLKICDAVEAAHRVGIIHRDLKPSNIRIDQRGEPHVLDFGLARTTLDDHAVSVTGEFLGSLPWSSPEQAQGNPEKIDTRTDVYSLGVILYQILTAGRFPYEVVGNIRDVLNNILNTNPMPPSQIASAAAGKSPSSPPQMTFPTINETIEKIVLKALAKKPEQRYQSAGELGRDIAKYLAGQRLSTKERKAQPLPQTTRFRTLYFVSGILLVIIAAIALTFHFSGNEPTPPQQAAITEPALSPQLPEPAQAITPIAPTPLPTAFAGNLHVLFKGGTFELFLNGKSFHQSAGDDIRTIPLALSPGDSLVLRVNSSFYYRSVRCAFLTGDPATSFFLTPENSSLRPTADSMPIATTEPATAPAPQIGPHDDRQQNLWQSADLPENAPWLALPNANVTYELAYTMPGVKIAAAAPEVANTPTPIAPPPTPKPLLPSAAVVTPPTENLAAASQKIDLLKLVDPLQDVVSGTWVLKDGKLACRPGSFVRVGFVYVPPEEYDLRVVFRITDGKGNIFLTSTHNNEMFVWGYGMSEKFAGFYTDRYTGGDPRNPTIRETGPVKHNEQYTVVLKVRKTSIQAIVNDAEISNVDLTTHKMGGTPRATLHKDCFVGVVTADCEMTISTFEVTEITGHGKALRSVPTPH